MQGLSEERRQRLAYLRSKYRESGAAGTPEASPRVAASPAVASPVAPPPGATELTSGQSRAALPAGGAIELRPPPVRWPASALPPGISSSSLVVVSDFWNAKLRQLTLHSGPSWPDEEKRAPQFSAVAASMRPPEGTVPVFDFWNGRLGQLTLHTGEARVGEVKKNLQFHAWARADGAGGGGGCGRGGVGGGGNAAVGLGVNGVAGGASPPPISLLPCYEWFNTKLRKVTAHTGSPWADETRGPHDILFFVLPPAPPPAAAGAAEGGASGAGEAGGAAAPSVPVAPLSGIVPPSVSAEAEECFDETLEVEVFENERWSSLRSEWGAYHLMPTDPPRFSTRLGGRGGASLAEVECPRHLRWAPAKVRGPGEGGGGANVCDVG
jgi:hypothetical protein